jgi:hypothetical protein
VTSEQKKEIQFFVTIIAGAIVNVWELAVVYHYINHYIVRGQWYAFPLLATLTMVTIAIAVTTGLIVGHLVRRWL